MFPEMLCVTGLGPFCSSVVKQYSKQGSSREIPTDEIFINFYI